MKRRVVPGWLTVKETASYCSRSERTIRNWLKEGLRHSRLRSGTILITMEWIVEGIALIFIGFANAIVTFIDYTNLISRAVYCSSVGVLIVLALVSIFAGFKINFFPFKLCPFIFSASAVLIVLGCFI